MRAKRVLQTLSLGGLLVLFLVLLTLTVSALDGLVGVLVLAVTTLVVVIATRMVSRRIDRGTVLEVDLDGGVFEQPPDQPIDRLLNRSGVALRDVTDALERAADDPRVVGLVARVGNGKLSVAQAQELRDAVRAFRESGKNAIAFSESFGEMRLATIDYYLAAAFEQICLLPMSFVSIQGVISRTPFLRGLFDRLGVTPDLDHRREYKAAKYVLTETDYVDPHREATTAILEDYMDQIVGGIAEDRSLEPARVRELIDGAPLYDSEALEAGLVDRIGYRDEAYEAAKGADGKSFMFVDEYVKRAGRPHRRGKRIALIYGTGSITRGSSGLDPLERGSTFGADDVAAAFREARDDRRVSAILFRVDSPGGSAVGSEVVYREIVRAREAGKPVVVSMGSVAGSGGYYVAAPADRIVAQPGTLTGSIGVVSGKIATREAWSKVGLNWGELHIGDNATYAVSDDPYSDSERERLEAGLDAIYEGFKARVENGRSLTPEHVEDIARGRVWTGAAAAENGLVDALGGLNRATELARELAGIDPEAPIKLEVFPRRRPFGIERAKPSSEPIRDALGVLSQFRTRAPVELRMQHDWAP